LAKDKKYRYNMSNNDEITNTVRQSKCELCGSENSFVTTEDHGILCKKCYLDIRRQPDKKTNICPKKDLPYLKRWGIF